MMAWTVGKHVWLAVLLAAIASPSMAQDVDPAKIVQSAIANAQRDAVLGRNYTYQLSNDWISYDKRWAPMQHTIRKFDVVFVHGEQYLRLIEEDGKTLSGKTAEQEQKRWEQLIAGIRTRLSPAQEQRSLYSFTLEGGRRFHTQVTREPIPFEDLPRLFDLKLMGTEPVQGRMAYVIDATPRPGITPADTWEEAELNDHVKLWIDVAERVPRRLHLDVLTNRSLVARGSTEDLEWEKINGEVWLLTRSVMRLPSSYRECHDVRSNFRKFTVKSAVLKELTLAPEDAVPAKPDGTGGPPPQDPVQLVVTAIANMKRNYHTHVRSYAFQKLLEITTFDKKGSASLRRTEKDDIILKAGDTCGYIHVVEMDGKPLSPAAAEEEQREYDQRVAACQSPQPAERHPDVYFLVDFRSRRGHRLVKYPIPFEDLPRLFDLRLLGSETVHGRSTYIVEGIPHPGTRPADSWEKDELGDQVKLWIDAADQVPVRLHFDVLASGSFLKKGSSFDAEWERVRDDDWFVTHSSLRMYESGRLQMDLLETFSQFRIFRVQTEVLASSQPASDLEMNRAAPGSPEPAAEEATVRAVVQHGFEAYARGDLPLLFSLFSPSSPNLLIAKAEIESSAVFSGKADLSALGVEDIRILGDTATARVSFEISSRQPDPGKGKRFYQFQLVREAGVWKLWAGANEEQELAADLVAAESDQERDAILTEQAPMVTEELADQLVGYGNGLVGVGDYTHAMASFQLAYKIAQRLDDKSALWKALYGLGHGNLVQGNLTLAENYFQKSLAVVEKLDNPSYLAFGLCQIGKSYAERGDYRQAMQYYEKSVAKSADRADREHLASTLQSMGDLFLQQGNQAQALEHYQKSLKLFAELEASVEIKLKTTAALGKIGEVLTRQGNYAQAIEYYQKNLTLFEELDHTQGVALVLRDMGDNYFLQGRSAQALEYYQKALAFFEEMEHRPGIAATLGRMGSVYYKSGDNSRAIELCRQAADIARELGSRPELSATLSTLGLAYFATSQYDQARRALTEAIENIEKLRARVAGGEQDQQLFFEGQVNPYYAMVQLLIEQRQFSQALEYAERAKGRALFDLLRQGKQDINKAMTQEEQTQEQAFNHVLAALNSQLAGESRQRRPSRILLQGIDNQIKRARLEYAAFETQVYSAHPDLKVQRGQGEPLSMQQLETLVPDTQTVFLEYVVTRDKTYLFALTWGNGPGGVVPGEMVVHVYTIDVNAQDLAQQIAGLRSQLGGNALDFRELARSLYDVLLSPAQQDLVRKKTLCVVPAGPLWELPFQALISPKGRYLLQDHALFYVPSLSVLWEMRNRTVEAASSNDGETEPPAPAAPLPSSSSSSSPVLFAVGNPALASRSSYSPLPEQEQLLRTLEQIYGPQNSRILTGSAARQEAVKAEAGKYRILHFATHGVLDNDSPLYSSLLLAGENGAEAGSLEAREIMQMDLHADLAVLSACETARGRFREGEGLIGMTWALFVAGTPTTVASQWKVDSASTAQLMAYFHRILKSQLSQAELPLTAAYALRHPLATYRLRKLQSWEELRINYAEALRQAALKLMSNPAYRHPFYWAGFVVMGDGLGNLSAGWADER